jgi:hypothetical protein
MKWTAGKIVVVTIFGIVALVMALMWGIPPYRVWQRALSGESQLREAEWNRKITIQEAEAKKESAKSLAAAEVERARGVAEANEIIGNSLKGNDAYLRYLWIQGLNDGSSETIYVPTEANLPIMEATRRQPSIVQQVIPESKTTRTPIVMPVPMPTVSP